MRLLPAALAADTPPRSISAAYYPNLIQLYKEAGVELTPWNWDMSFLNVGDSRAAVCVAAAADIAVPFRGSSTATMARIAKDALR